MQNFGKICLFQHPIFCILEAKLRFKKKTKNARTDYWTKLDADIAHLWLLSFRCNTTYLVSRNLGKASNLSSSVKIPLPSVNHVAKYPPKACPFTMISRACVVESYFAETSLDARAKSYSFNLGDLKSSKDGNELKIQYKQLI